MTKKKKPHASKRAPNAAAVGACEGMGLMQGGCIDSTHQTEKTEEVDEDEDGDYVWAVRKWIAWLRSPFAKNEAECALDGLVKAIEGMEKGEVKALEVDTIANEVGLAMINGGSR